MNFEVDELLDHVDEWKFKLHEKLKNLNLTPEQEAELWKQSPQRTRALGVTVPEPEQPAKRPVKISGLDLVIRFRNRFGHLRRS